MNNLLVPLVILCLTKQALAPTAASDTAEILEPLSVMECAGFVSAPVALHHRHGRFYLLDPMEQVVWTFSETRDVRETAVVHPAKLQAVELPSASVYSFFFGCGDALHLVDPMERALYVQESTESSWQRRFLGYRVFFGAGDQRGILFNADRRYDDHLVTVIACAGDTLLLGVKLTNPHPYASVVNSLNYARMAVASDLIVVGHIALGYLQVYDRNGERFGEVFLSGPEIREMRRVYLASQGMKATGECAVDHNTLVEDLIQAARPDRFPLPVYINDLTIHAGLIWVLSNNTLQVHSRHGELLARRKISGQHRGELVVIHAFCITSEGRLFGLDAVHYHKIYDFGPVTMLVSGQFK